MCLPHEHIGPKILVIVVKIYILTRAELLFPLCNEIPCISKSGLMSESFSLWLKSQKKGVKSQPWALSTKREDAQCCELAFLFLDLSQNEKLSEIKLPLSTYLFFRLLKIDSARVKINPAASVNNNLWLTESLKLQVGTHAKKMTCLDWDKYQSYIILDPFFCFLFIITKFEVTMTVDTKR